jgi:hypothetical protein
MKKTLHSGGAKGSDTIWELNCQKFGLLVRAYSYKTDYHKSPNKYEISQDDYLEGIEMVKKANLLILKRILNPKYLNLLSRNWSQVKYSDSIWAIGWIIKPGERCKLGYLNKSKYDVVSGGTGWATAMAIIVKKPLFVFDQDKKSWFKWSYILNKFIEVNEPIIESNNFAGIGTRQIDESGIIAIENICEKSFKK